MSQTVIDQTSRRVTRIDYAGDDVVIKLRYPMEGALLDLSGYGARFYLLDDRAPNGQVVFEIDEQTGLLLGDFESHNIVITIPSNETAQLGQGGFPGFLVLTDPDGRVDTKAEITLQLKAR